MVNRYLGDMQRLKLFVGINCVGIWDELFFVNVVFNLLRVEFPFWVANFAQAFKLLDKFPTFMKSGVAMFWPRMLTFWKRTPLMLAPSIETMPIAALRALVIATSVKLTL